MHFRQISAKIQSKNINFVPYYSSY